MPAMKPSAKKLRELIETYAEAYKDKSWSGADDPVNANAYDDDLRDAKKALDDYINAFIA